MQVDIKPAGGITVVVENVTYGTVVLYQHLGSPRSAYIVCAGPYEDKYATILDCTRGILVQVPWGTEVTIPRKAVLTVEE